MALRLCPLSSANTGMDRVRIRPIRPSDESALSAFYAGLSDELRRARFLSSASGLDEVFARQMSLPGAGEAGYVAEQLDCSGSRIVGHVSLTEAGPNAPEIAIAVADRCQHQGLGRHLFLAATSWAEANDVDSMVATAFTDNWRVILFCAVPATPPSCATPVAA